jgi:tRNA U34 5-carboxymethylaminomethyl modifying GTPase MnmE/TrmE
MPQPKRIFFSYPHADRAFADRLARSLADRGFELDELDPSRLERNGSERVDERVRSADAVLLLINPQSKLDEPQQRVWRSVLAAAWDNPKLCLLPLLLQDAELPPFVRSAASGSAVQAIRIQDESDIGRAVDAVRANLRSKKPGQGKGERKLSISVRKHPATVEIYPSSDANGRRKRLSENRGVVEQLKSSK